MTDHVDKILAQWAERRPDLDASPMAVCGRLTRLARLVTAEQGKTFAKHGLDRSSFDVLATLRRAGHPHLTPAELMHAAMVTSGAISQRLDRLEERGLVTRSNSREDRRVVEVALTPEGLNLIDRALPDHLATEERLLTALSGEGRAELAAMLKTLLVSLGDEV